MRDLVGICHNRPSEAQRFRFGGLQAALQASLSLAWSCSQCAILMAGLRPALSLPVGGHLCVGVF
ncbi:MAG: hypothetical protein PUE80_01980 [bacterium]|nr:hypothetical protein [bacterium]